MSPLADAHRVAGLDGGRLTCVCGWRCAERDAGRAYLAHCQHLIACFQAVR